jgi:hypothetical protein
MKKNLETDAGAENNDKKNEQNKDECKRASAAVSPT